MIVSIKRLPATILIVLVIISCQNHSAENNQSNEAKEFITPLGKKMVLSEPSAKMLAQYEKAKQDFDRDPTNADNIIWYGRSDCLFG